MTIIKSLINILGETGVIHGEEVQKRAADWLGESVCGAMAIARPKTVEELSKTLKFCFDNNISVVPSGGLTGLVEGTKAESHQIQISTERMNNILEIDAIGKTITLESGVPLQKLLETAREHELMFAVDLGARGSCTIGGNISTNAGGNQVIRYGMMRNQVLGLEAVLMDGTIISSLNKMIKNNTGYDLKQLFIGSEGTLGIITKAVLKLEPLPKSSNTAFLGVNSFEDVGNILKILSAKFGSALSSFEVLWKNHYELIAVQTGKHNPPLPADYEYYILVQTQGFDPEKDNLYFNETLEKMAEDELFLDAIICQNAAQQNAIWAIREDVEGLFKAMKPCAVFDVALPIKHMEEYVSILNQSLLNEWGDGAKIVVYGHVGDCNLHILISPPIWNKDTHLKCEEIVYSPLKSFNGSISAEHGIGIEKREFLHYSRDENEMALMKLLKKSLDPKNLLNPNKIFN